MNQSVTPVKNRSCFKCGYRAETADTKCPECKRPLHTSTSIRIRGFLMVLCGVILMAMMGYITVSMFGLSAGPNGTGAKFNGTPDQMRMIMALFAALITFGFMAFLTGLIQLILGWRSRLLSWIVVGFGVLVFVGGYLISSQLGK